MRQKVKYFTLLWGAFLAQDSVPESSGDEPVPEKNCPAGYYCDVETGLEYECPVGFYCPEDTFMPIPCPGGTISYLSRLQSIDDCVLCPASYYCPEGQTKDYDCPAGYYCPEGSSQPLDCGTGNYCPEFSGRPTPCPSGTFSEKLNNKDIYSCDNCEPGSIALIEGSSSCVECEEGSFSSLDGTECLLDKECEVGLFNFGDVCLECPPGYNFNAEDVTCIGCEIGTFNSDFASQCRPCDAGSYCPETELSVPVPCLAGFYCPTGAIQPLPCPENQFSIIGAAACSACGENLTPNTNQTRCIQDTPCAPGQEKVLEDEEEIIYKCYDCSPGTFASEDDVCVKCPKGYFSKYNKGISCSDCGLGFYCPETGLIDPIKCPKNFECIGLNAIEASPCDDGFYSLEGDAECFEPNCPAGYLFNEISFNCEACPAGTFFDGEANRCQICPENSVSAIAGAIECQLCPENFFESNREKTACVYKDGEDSQFICPDGLYPVQLLYSQSEDSINQTFNSCDQCSPGQYGVNGECFECPDGSYSSDFGSVSCSVCDTGFVVPNDDKTRCEACPAGTRWTPNNVCAPCTGNQYQPLIAQSICQSCLGLATLESNTKCSLPPASWLCENGQGLNSTGSCQKCSAGTYADKLVCQPCPVGYYQDQEGQSTCKLCLSENIANVTGSNSCDFEMVPLEDSCGTGAFYDYENEECELCPPGTFLNTESKTCVDCPLGCYNRFPGAENGCPHCGPGTYCPFRGMLEPFLCPAGSFCELERNIQPEICSITSFTDFEGAIQCSDCPRGQYSDPSRQVCAACEAGFFASLDDGSCKECPMGTYAPYSGSSECQTCDSGYVNAERTICEPGCPAGHIRKREERPMTVEQDEGGTLITYSIYISCEPCPKGFYQTGTICKECGVQTYNPFESQTECQFCEGRVFDEATQCFDENSSCPAGHFNNGFDCEECPLGTFFPIPGNQPECLPANPGFYCPNTGMVEELSCPAGFYCPENYVSEPFACPAGFFCVIESITPELCVADSSEFEPLAENDRIVLENNIPMQSECIFIVERPADICPTMPPVISPISPVYPPKPEKCDARERRLIQPKDFTIRPEHELNKMAKLCVHTKIFKCGGRAPALTSCHSWRPSAKWSFKENIGHIIQYKNLCEYENKCEWNMPPKPCDDEAPVFPLEPRKQRPSLCWTAKNIGLNRRITMEKCRKTCDQPDAVAVANQRFEYKTGRVRLVDTDFCVSWSPRERFMTLVECRFDIFG